MCKEYATVEKKTGNYVRIYDEKEVAEHVTASMGDEFQLVELKDFDYDDVCYECMGYGDDYHYNSYTGEWVCNCDYCPYEEDYRLYEEASQDDD